MNHTKGCAQSRDGLTHFLTYADNNAVGYFLKQGFTKEISLPRSCWSGYIKDYDGGTLMEFVFHKELPYTNLPKMIRKQRALLDSNIREKSKSHVEHPGMVFLFCTSSKVSFLFPLKNRITVHYWFCVFPIPRIGDL